MPDPTLLNQLPPVFTHAEAGKLGISDHRLYGWRDEGTIEQLGRGLYRRSGFPGDPNLIEIAVRANRATLCLATALARHQLIDEIPHTIDVAIPRATRPPKLRSPVSWHRFNESTFDMDRTEIPVIDGYTLGLYGPRRSIIDAFRLRHREGYELANDALRGWLKRRGSQPAELLSMSKHFPAAEKTIRTALEILL